MAWRNMRIHCAGGLCAFVMLAVVGVLHAQISLPTFPPIAPPTPTQGNAKGQLIPPTDMLPVLPAADAAPNSAPGQEDLKARLDRLEKQNQELLQALKGMQPRPQGGPVSAADAEGSTLGKDDVKKIVGDYLKSRDEEAKAKEAAKKAEPQPMDHGVPFLDHQIFPRAHEDTPEHDTFLQSLYDSLSTGKESKKWYEKLSIRGYTQMRFGRTLGTDEGTPNLFGDRTINGNRENFLIRRARLILSGDVSDHLFLYFQPDFASNTDGAANNTFFTQLRDLYADIYIDKDKVNRFRVGLSKVPYGWENLQSSQNRIPLDRTDAMNTAVAPNERDLGVIYYWTPVAQQKLFQTLVNGGLKGSGNYGIFGFGVYNGQGGAQFEQNLDLHTVARFTWPVELPSGQVVEGSIQALRGRYRVTGADISPLGKGDLITPKNTGGTSGIMEQRVAASFVVFPQPFGFQAEWQVGDGPGLNDAQTAVVRRHLNGGYIMGMYRHETETSGIFTPYCRYQQYTGGYRNIANAPFGHQRQVDFGVEWQLRKELELVFEYSLANTPNFRAIDTVGSRSYRDFEGSLFRVQLQFNY